MPPTVTTERRWPWSVNWAMLCRRMCHASSRAWRLRTGVFVLTTSTALVRVTAGLLAQAAVVRMRRHNVKLSALFWDISIHKMTSRHGILVFMWSNEYSGLFQPCVAVNHPRSRIRHCISHPIAMNLWQCIRVQLVSSCRKREKCIQWNVCKMQLGCRFHGLVKVSVRVKSWV